MNPTIEAMARAIMRRKVAAFVESRLLTPDMVELFIDREADVCSPAWRESVADALAALRALAACEPSEAEGLAGARSLRDSLRWDNQIQRGNAVRRAMLAELVKECERDA